MAVASDLPDLENRKEYQDARNSVLYDYTARVARRPDEQPEPGARHATTRSRPTCATRSSRSRTGASTRTPASTSAASRARSSRTSSSSARVQGGSTITQQFVKNALRAQNQRTVFQKLREAALAYHLTRKWSKAKILTQYLNSIYFGNGAYGIESAARTYFGKDHPGCGTRGARLCVSVLRPRRPRCSPGVVANPSGYDPVAHPVAAERRRNLVLQRMFEQGRLGRAAVLQRAPGGAARPRPEPPTVRTTAPYFTTWVRQQLVDRFGARRAFEGGLKITTTLDADLQKAAENTVKRYFSNPTGRRRRSSRSTTTPARSARWSAGATTTRARSTSPRRASASPARRSSRSCSPRRCGAGSARRRCGPRASACSTSPAAATSSSSTTSRAATRGSNTLAGALTASDNSIFAAVGLQVGTKRIARLARADGDPDAGLVEPGDDARRAASRASRRSTWRTRTRRSPTTACGSTGRWARASRGRSGCAAVSTCRRRPHAVVLAKNKMRRRRVLAKDIVADDRRDHADGHHARHRQARRRSPTARSRRARPARPRTAATPGSSASPTGSRSRCGSAIRTSSSRC